MKMKEIGPRGRPKVVYVDPPLICCYFVGTLDEIQWFRKTFAGAFKILSLSCEYCCCF